MSSINQSSNHIFRSLKSAIFGPSLKLSRGAAKGAQADLDKSNAILDRFERIGNTLTGSFVGRPTGPTGGDVYANPVARVRLKVAAMGLSSDLVPGIPFFSEILGWTDENGEIDSFRALKKDPEYPTESAQQVWSYNTNAKGENVFRIENRLDDATQVQQVKLTENGTLFEEALVADGEADPTKPVEATYQVVKKAEDSILGSGFFITQATAAQIAEEGLQRVPDSMSPVAAGIAAGTISTKSCE